MSSAFGSEVGKCLWVLDDGKSQRTVLQRETAEPNPDPQGRARDMSTLRPVSTFFGRAQELARIDRGFAAGAPAITILGGPGAGKTRLAREWALRNARGAVLVELAGARTTADAQSRIAHALGVGAAALDDALARRPFLILDEAESLRGQVPIERWCTGRLLITSRARLGFDGEAVIDLGPLEGGDAEALFRDRATRAGATIEDRCFRGPL